jgi:predicted membrane channel-forming protein YqfA (hemolysin III family)
MTWITFLYWLPALVCAVFFFLWPPVEDRVKGVDVLAMALFALVPVVNLLSALLMAYALGRTACLACAKGAP